MESELVWIDEYLPADELKLKLKNISEIGPIWPVIVNYLEEKRYRVEKVREFMPAHFVRIMPNFYSPSTGELIFYLDMGRTLARARESYIPEGKVKARLCYIEASGSAGRFVEGWRRYCRRDIQSYRVEGDHFSMLKGATAARSAKALDRALHLE